jgi:PRTRC genetic system ThiF family protein
MRIKLPEFRTLSSYHFPGTIVLVGCGGTGGYVVGPLARMIKVSKDLKIRLVLIDGDDVEEKNLKRQHFIKRDLGRNKAEVMAGRYAGALGMDIHAVPEYLENPDTLRDLQPIIWNNSMVVIGCVDNNASRRVIHKWFMIDGTRSKFWIDSGNEESSGQVICGYRPNSVYPRQTEFSLPTVTEIYPEILDGDLKFNSQLSCAELAEVAPQNMMANVTAATLILNFVHKIIHGKPLDSHGVSFTVDNVFRTMLNTEDALRAVTISRLRTWERAPETKRKPRKRSSRKELQL